MVEESDRKVQLEAARVEVLKIGSKIKGDRLRAMEARVCAS